MIDFENEFPLHVLQVQFHGFFLPMDLTPSFPYISRFITDAVSLYTRVLRQGIGWLSFASHWSFPAGAGCLLEEMR